MRTRTALGVTIIALANLAVTVLHLFLAGKLNPALTVAGSMRINLKLHTGKRRHERSL